MALFVLWFFCWAIKPWKWIIKEDERKLLAKKKIAEEGRRMDEQYERFKERTEQYKTEAGKDKTVELQPQMMKQDVASQPSYVSPPYVQQPGNSQQSAHAYPVARYPEPMVLD